MFDLDPGKLIVIGIVALVAIPTKDLPRVLRQIGQMTGRMRRMASEFQGQFMDAMREAELADLHKNLKSDVDSAFAGVREAVAFDPLKEAREQIVGAIEGPPPPVGEARTDEARADQAPPDETRVDEAPPAAAPATDAETPPEGQGK